MKPHYSHFGEDVLLDFVFKDQDNGFYVDVGAYHPVLFSNTKLLYDRGWKGINIDPNIKSIEIFKEIRPRDINLNIAVSDQEGELDYYKFLEIDEAGGGSGNSLSEEVKNKYESQGLTAQVSRVEVKQLTTIFDKYLHNKTIDLLNVDVEGFDLRVLKSNDWNRYKPRIIAIEIWINEIDFDNLFGNSIYQYLLSLGYKAFSCLLDTWFFYDTAYPLFQRKETTNQKILESFISKMRPKK